MTNRRYAVNAAEEGAAPFYYEVWWLTSGNLAGTATTPEELLDFMDDDYGDLGVGIVVNDLTHFVVGPEHIPWLRAELTRMIAIHKEG